MTDFMYFFVGLYFLSSLIAYTIKSYKIPEAKDVSWTSVKHIIGDFAVRTFFIFVVYWAVEGYFG